MYEDDDQLIMEYDQENDNDQQENEQEYSD